MWSSRKIFRNLFQGHWRIHVTGEVLDRLRRALMLRAGRVITEYANKSDIDCVVIGSHKPGLRDYFLGSTAARVVRHAKCAVHVLRV